MPVHARISRCPLIYHAVAGADVRDVPVGRDDRACRPIRVDGEGYLQGHAHDHQPLPHPAGGVHTCLLLSRV